MHKLFSTENLHFDPDTFDLIVHFLLWFVCKKKDNYLVR